MNISQIPESINRYAVDWAYKIRDRSVECAKGFDIKDGKVFDESDLMIGLQNSINYDFKYDPKDIIVHDHPGIISAPLSFQDIYVSVNNGVKKIFASTPEGYTSMDFTTRENIVSKKSIVEWLKNAITEQKCLQSELRSEYRDFNASSLQSEKMGLILREFLIRKMDDFSRLTGSTFEKIKWNDLK